MSIRFLPIYRYHSSLAAQFVKRKSYLKTYRNTCAKCIISRADTMPTQHPLNYKRLVQCEDCGHWMLPESLPQHQKEFHPKDPVIIPLTARDIPVSESQITEQKRICPICHFPLKTSLGTHMRMVHRRSASAWKKSGGVIPPPEDFIHCPVCGQRILSTNLQKHLRKVHHQ